MRKRKRLVSIVLLIAILNSILPHAFAIEGINSASSRFEGTLLFDDTTSFDPSDVEVKVYTAVAREKKYDWLTEYDEFYSFSVSPNQAGYFSFTPPSPEFSISIETSSLPSGYGVRETNWFYASGDAKEIDIELERINSASLEIASLAEEPKVIFTNESGDLLFASYEFVADYQEDTVDDDVVVVSGTVVQRGDELFDLSTKIDTASLDPITRANQYYDKGIIDEDQKIQRHFEAAKAGEVPGELAPFVDEQFSMYLNSRNNGSKVQTVQREKLQDALEAFSTRASAALNARLATLTGYKTSTHFDLHYNPSITSANATEIINFLETMYNYTDAIGFRDPIPQTGKSKVQVYLDTGTNPEPDYVNANGVTYPVDATGNVAKSYITLWKFNANEMSKFKETVAHEYFHSVQNAYYYHNNWFKEASAVWFAARYAGSIERAKSHFNKYFVNIRKTISTEDLQYGAGVLPMAISVAYGNSPTIRRVYERMATYGASTETNLRACITYAIQQQDSSGSFAEAYKKLGAYTTMPGHFFSSVIPTGTTWDNNAIPNYSPIELKQTATEVLQSFGCKPYSFQASNVEPKTLELTFVMPSASTTNHSVRLVRVTNNGSIIPFGGDVTSDKYTAIVSNFCKTTTSNSETHDIVYATPINVGSSSNTFEVQFQLK